MDAKTFLKQFGVKETKRISEVAGTRYVYFGQIAYGHRRPSVELAERLVAASGGRLSFEALLRSKKAKQQSKLLVNPGQNSSPGILPHALTPEVA